MPKCKKCGAEISPPEDPMFDEGREELVVGGQRTKLPPMEWTLLMVLRARLGRTVPREFITDCLWGREVDAPYEETLYKHICLVRKQLQGTSYRIVTLKNVGYRLERRRA